MYPGHIQSATLANHLVYTWYLTALETLGSIDCSGLARPTPLFEKRNYFFSGTLGDAYIALCKLNSVSSDALCTLRRLCRYAGSDTAIAKIATLFPNIEYDADFIQFSTIEDMRDFAFRHVGRYINIFWDGNGRGNEPDDPSDVRFVEFPSLGIQRQRFSTRSKHIGIHLHSGSRDANQRALDIEWVVEVCELLAGSPLGIVLLGTGQPYSQAELSLLQRLPHNGINLLGPYDIIAWLQQIASVDYFIAPEGLASYFAQSQGIPGLTAYREASAVLRMPTSWRNNTICIRPNVRSLENGKARWIPIAASSMADILLARFDPEHA